jgi:hypothetical protein
MGFTPLPLVGGSWQPRLLMRGGHEVGLWSTDYDKAVEMAAAMNDLLSRGWLSVAERRSPGFVFGISGSYELTAGGLPFWGTSASGPGDLGTTLSWAASPEWQPLLPTEGGRIAIGAEPMAVIPAERTADDVRSAVEAERARLRVGIGCKRIEDRITYYPLAAGLPSPLSAVGNWTESLGEAVQRAGWIARALKSDRPPAPTRYARDPVV